MCSTKMPGEIGQVLDGDVGASYTSKRHYSVLGLSQVPLSVLPDKLKSSPIYLAMTS